MSWSRLLLLAALLLAFLVPSSSPVMAGAGIIQPGDFVSVAGAGCTLNFVYDGVGVNAGKVYMGTAAHCVGAVGQSASTTSHAAFGTVAFIRSACCAALDYAFIEVKPAFVVYVDPAVRGHPDFPIGYTQSTETALGDLVYISGYGMVFNTHAVLRHQRVGVLTSDNPDLYRMDGPIIFGDSGGPLVHASGKALGIVSRLPPVTIPPASDEGPTIEQVLQDSAAQGFPVTLRTV